MQLLRLTLTDFRNYAALTWRPRARISVLYRAERQRQDQPAGGGVAAGARPRPARRPRPPTCRGTARPGGWAVAGRFSTAQGEADIGTGTPPDGAGDRRVFRLDGAAPRSQAEIAARIAAVWLTPQMDRLFQEGLSGRRRFLDRLVWALEPGHAREMAAHDAAMGSRNRLLAEGRARAASWLAGLEDAMARHARGRHGRPDGSGAPAECVPCEAVLSARFRRRGSAWSARSPTGWRPSRRWRWRTGCAPAWQRTGRAMRRPAPRRWARIAPTWR